jgi:uncharacterized Fe-S cluster-containing protein
MKEILAKLPGKDCGSCGMKTCASFAEIVSKDENQLSRCIYIEEKQSCQVCPMSSDFKESDITWQDQLGRDYDFILDKYPNEPGPRETIILFNPTQVEKLGLKKGDICYGRPAWISCGCPVTHAGIIMEDPDYFNGIFTWCVVGPLLARERGINIGFYNTTCYEGLVNFSKEELVIGKRYWFQPRFCMLQWRHCGLVNQLGKTKDGLRARIEGLWIG